MPYLKITPGVSALSGTGRILSPALRKIPDSLKGKVWEQDDHTCRYCGFKAKKYQDVVYNGAEDATTATDPKDFATACTFCHQCFSLERVSQMQSGALIWLPEIGQAALHHICRAIYVARISQGPAADAARDALEALLARKVEARNRLGTDSPHVLAGVLQDFFEPREYKARAGRLKGFRILPLDRRIIKEGDLEFNQFPQILAYWRSKEGPFGDAPPRTWGKTFFELQDRMAAAPPQKKA